MRTHAWRGSRPGLLVAVCGALVVLLASASVSTADAPPHFPRAVLHGGVGRLALATVAGQTGTCGKTPGLTCSDVEVPLDRAAQVQGTIRLHVEVLPASGPRRGVMFLVAGGPGQGSASTFTLGSAGLARFYRFLFPGYTLVAFDARGTGASGVLGCPALQRAASSWNVTQLVAECAEAIGPRRSFYSTADHAEDLEAVRQALGFDRIGIWGVSYGTRLALAYARTHPTHVERLLLDSVVAPDRDDTFGTDVLKAMPTTLDAYCANGACRAATPDFGGDVVAVANALAAKPLRGRVLESNGRATAERLDAADFLGMVVGADLSPGLAAELPAAVHAARTGDSQPLLHAFHVAAAGESASASDLSFALYLATECGDGRFPWLPDTPVADRPDLVKAALAALPAGSFGPFGDWAEKLGDVELCLGWPSPAGEASLPAGPLPDIDVLAVSGGLDLRTPTAGAASVVALFPRGHLLVVPGVGHSVLTADPSGCSQRAVRAWILGSAPPASCAAPRPYLSPLAAFPARGSKRLDARQTLAVAGKTLHEAEAAWLMTATDSTRQSAIPGVYGGKLAPAERAFVLERYSIAPGVTLTGHISLAKAGAPLVFKGYVIVDGAAAARGLLELSGSSLHGRLGHRLVGR